MEDPRLTQAVERGLDLAGGKPRTGREVEGAHRDSGVPTGSVSPRSGVEVRADQ
jgi:hypothetical protein